MLQLQGTREKNPDTQGGSGTRGTTPEEVNSLRKMNIRTQWGDKIFCLPDCARCRITGKSPEDMDSCPIINFDDFGDECVPELCDEYEED